MRPAKPVKKITIDQLRPGMYIHDLDCGWMSHPFLRNRFPVHDQDTIDRVANAGIQELYIDTDKGDDVWINSPPPLELPTSREEKMRSIAETAKDKAEQAVSLEEERRRALGLFRDASSTVHGVLEQARLGQVMELERLSPVVERVVDSVFRHGDALIPLARLKRQDSYAYQHAVASAALMAALGRSQNLPREQIEELALGALLQDAGMSRVPEQILNKPSRLSQKEIEVVHSHVGHSHDIAQALHRLPQTSLDVVAQHHERNDGSGYPFRLEGSQISTAGQMAAIVDVYDALTSQRPFQNAADPTHALRKMFEWGSRQHFNGSLVESFIRALGIYPVGSLVRMESGFLGVVMEQTNDLLKPVVKIIYNTRTGNYLVPPVTIRVGRHAGANHGPIIAPESFSQWSIDPARWVPT